MASEEIKKTAVINMYDSPYDKATHDSGVVFYNLDIATAVLEFHIKKDNFPLQISDKNVDTYVYLKGTDRNGNPYGRQLDVEYIDPFNGIVSLTVPNDYLQTVNNSTVTGQMYISLHRDNRVPETKSDTAVLNEFKFRVRDSLINSISGVTKIEYIRMFDKLRDEIQKRISDIEEAIANGEDYVAEMKTVLSDGTKLINDTAEKAVNTVNTTSNNAIETVNTTKDTAVNTITNARDEVLNVINDNEVVRKTEMSGYFDEQDWQKYPLTNSDGARKFITSLEQPVETLEPGLYECVIPANAETVNAPTDVNNSAYVAEINITKGIRNRKQIILIQNYTKDVWLKTIHTDSVDRGWVLLNRDYEKDLNWQKYKLTEKNGKSLTVDLKNDLKKLQDLSPGMYYLTNVPALPTGVNNEGNAISVHKNENSYTPKRQILYMPFNNSDIYICNNEINFTGWQKVGPSQGDTGWVPFQLVNGAKSNTEYGDDLGNGFKCSYRTVVNGSLVTNYLRINGRSISPGTVIGRLPSKMVKNVQTFIPRTPINKPIGYIILYTNGDIKFFTNDGTGTNSWDDSAYIYGEFSWTN